jgi:hypothetical protein
MDNIQHEPECSGWHMPEVGCLWFMAQCEAVLESRWHCPESGMYHRFDEESDYCTYGCGQSLMALESSL